MSLTPPCKKSLIQHIKKVNHQDGIWKRANEANPQIRCPTEGHGRIRTREGIKPFWYDGDAQPADLNDLAEPSNESDSDDDSDAPSEVEEDIFTDSDDDDDD